MKQLTVPFQQIMVDNVSTGAVASALRTLEKHTVAYAPWSSYPYKPSVQFSIAHCPSAILLQFDVREKHMKAVHGNINDPVYKDSCVEFFIGFDEGMAYYNFEFNCLGTVLAGFGGGKTDRAVLPQAELEKIRAEVLISRGEEQAQWEITLVLPFTVFVHHPLLKLQGRPCSANFYKCGDDLPEPHFLSWSNIVSKEPNFHLPEFFGVLSFQ
jgi:hypothetical protein